MCIRDSISGVRILLVEDNELNAEIAEFILTENGAKVETVKNGLEAVQHFETCESGTYYVILMDVMMPVMDGLTAVSYTHLDLYKRQSLLWLIGFIHHQNFAAVVETSKKI